MNLLTLKDNFLSKTGALLLAGAFTGMISPNIFAQAPPIPKNYVCYQPKSKIIIDGKLDEKSWKQAEWTDLFEDIEGPKKPAPLQKTRAKMLWDEQYLYIAAEIEEEDIWAYQNQKDQVVFMENDFEVFIDPDGDTHNYYELEINAINNSFDLFLPKPYRNGGRAAIPWNIDGLKSAVTIDGTLNDISKRDKKWILEIAIPHASLKHEDIPAVIPTDGSLWRINFSRVNWHHDFEDGKYLRKKNPETKRNLPEFNWVWSPQGVINMHVPERWGYLLFAKETVGKKKVPFQLPYVEKMKLMAREVYEKQREYFRVHKHYAANIDELHLDNVSESDRKVNIFETEGSGNHFKVLVSNEKENKKVSVAMDGLVTVSDLKP
ncbi:carbohydrate-binding family 9-like protein [Dyadobacter helix]|uniref:carbohydrate-binding family 9-like protein n=1 Tax=Dyadobacter helix TaxID=2822344 RepID=UPI001E2AF9B4|nr:carbohydrate-binding family 9-like protein [Dyadobacter sp. CECT 9275]